MSRPAGLTRLHYVPAWGILLHIRPMRRSRPGPSAFILSVPQHLQQLGPRGPFYFLPVAANQYRLREPVVVAHVRVPDVRHGSERHGSCSEPSDAERRACLPPQLLTERRQRQTWVWGRCHDSLNWDSACWIFWVTKWRENTYSSLKCHRFVCAEKQYDLFAVVEGVDEHLRVALLCRPHLVALCRLDVFDIPRFHQKVVRA